MGLFLCWITACFCKAIVNCVLICACSAEAYLSTLFIHSFFKFSIAFSFIIFIVEPSESSPLSFFPADRAQHRPTLPRRSPSPTPPVRLGLPFCNHGGDEDEVPLSEKGEAGPGTVAPLLGCHSGRRHDLQPGLHPKDRTTQEGRGTFQVSHITTIRRHDCKALFSQCFFHST